MTLAQDFLSALESIRGPMFAAIGICTVIVLAWQVYVAFTNRPDDLDDDDE